MVFHARMIDVANIKSRIGMGYYLHGLLKSRIGMGYYLHGLLKSRIGSDTKVKGGT